VVQKLILLPALLQTPSPIPKFGTQCGPIQKYWTALCTFDRRWEECKLRPGRPSSLKAATKSGASGLAERVSMMLFGSCICQATWRPAAAAEFTSEPPQLIEGFGKKDVVGETAFPMKFITIYF